MKINNNILQKCVIIISIFLVHSSILLSQNYNTTSDIDKKTYKAYLMNNIIPWKKVVKIYETKYNNSENNYQLLYELTKAQYGLINSCVSNKDKETFKKYIEHIDKNIEKLLEHNNEWASVYALKAGIISFKMSFFPWKAVYYGPKQNEAIKNAIKYNKNEPLAWYQKGCSKYFSPEQYGGSYKDAIKYYKKAITLYKKHSNDLKYNWNYLNNYAWLGQAYEKMEKYEKAISIYNKALNIEPKYRWVKQVLLPRAQKKLNK